jgi:hypothetical protein
MTTLDLPTLSAVEHTYVDLPGLPIRIAEAVKHEHE